MGTDIIFISVTIVGLFFSIFMIARMFRDMNNSVAIPLLDKLKWFLSGLTGILLSGVFLLGNASYSTQKIIATVFVFLFSAISSWFGFTLGMKDSWSINENTAPTRQTTAAHPPSENLIIEETHSSVKISIKAKKRWGWLVLSLFEWMFVGLIVVPLTGIIIIDKLIKFLPEYFHVGACILVSALVLILLWYKLRDVLEYMYDREVIEIDNQSVRIEKSGWFFKSRKVYAAENITKITPFVFLGFDRLSQRKSSFLLANNDAFMLWHLGGIKRFHTFGRAVFAPDTYRVIETIYRKYPQYKEG